MVQLLLFLSVYFVSFVDKPITNVSPALSPRAIDQRQKWNIAIDELDYPVNVDYLDSIRSHGCIIHHTSRWMNGATCSMTDEQAEEVASLSFVSNIEMTRDASSEPIIKRRSVPLSHEECNQLLQLQATDMQSDQQLALYNLQPLHDLGYHGEGILMTICDVGFCKANELSCFRQQKELGHFDFTDDSSDFYGSDGTHGLYCLSTISGQTDEYMGAATEAEYYLMRTEEYETESPKELDNLVAAFEKADSLGTNVFSMSLGYNMFDNEEWDLDYYMLDGKQLRASRAATIAARKGMLVCNVAGNEGNQDWHWIVAPADADSILTVGAVSVDGVIGSFSSYGPTADNRIKPEVCAVGVRTAVINENEQIQYSNGVSYATPLLAGMAATLWSALPDKSAMQIRELIIRSCDRYNNPDNDQYGYGIPNAYAAYMSQVVDIKDSSTITIFGREIDPSQMDSTGVVDVYGDSTLVYNPEENTLTLNNLTLEVGEEESTAINYTGTETLTIVLNDSSSIMADTIIASTADVIITGEGTLIAEGTVPIIGVAEANITFDSVNMHVQSLPSAAAVRRRIRGGKRVDETGGPALSGFGSADFNKVDVTPSDALYGSINSGSSDAEFALYALNGAGEQQVLSEFTLTAKADEPNAVEQISTPQAFDPTKPMYNILGVQVDASYKGIIIQNGNKYLR